MEKNIRIAWLLGFYGEFLTGKQRSLMDMHYNEDLSLAEIAGREGITRQGVHDALRRGAEILEHCEQRLGLLAKYLAVKAGLAEINGFLAGRAALGEQEMRALKEKLAAMAMIWEGEDGL